MGYDECGELQGKVSMEGESKPRKKRNKKARKREEAERARAAGEVEKSEVGLVDEDGAKEEVGDSAA